VKKIEDETVIDEFNKPSHMNAMPESFDCRARARERANEMPLWRRQLAGRRPQKVKAPVTLGTCKGPVFWD
jgi:hypothetical protein